MILPPTLPIAALAVTPQGRVRAIEGDVHLVGVHRLGELESEVLGRIHVGLHDRLARTGAALLEYPSGLRVQWHRRSVQNGFILVVHPVAKTESHQRASDMETALKERTAFFASLGHDLKTPLNAIIGFADMMKSGIRGPLPDAYQDYAEIIHESGEDLLLLVDDLMDLAKADASALNLDRQPVDLAASGQSVIRQMGAAAERAGVTLTLKSHDADQTWADADARAVRQIWQNLVSNAIKYSSKGDTVQLEVFAYAGRVVLAVEDEGAGMDADDLARLAEPFAQGKNASGRAGTGLGLAVVKSFADLHGGQVKVDTRLGDGTRVEVTFRPADPNDLSDFEEAAQ